MEKVHAAWRCISVTDQPKKYLLSRLVDFLSVYGHYMLLAILPTGHPRYPRYPKCIVTVLYQLYHYIYIYILLMVFQALVIWHVHHL